MKILTLTSHITSNALPCFQKNKTGFGYMVHDIISALSCSAEVDVLVFYYRFKSLKLDGANYLGCSWWDIFSNLYNCISPIIPIKMIRKYHISRGASIRLMYCWMLTGYYKKILKKGNYNIVHVHGLLFPSELWLNICNQLNLKCVLTCHGLVSFSDAVKIEQGGKEYERFLLKRASEGKLNLTVISTGIKRIIENTYHFFNCENIAVVLNAFSFNESTRDKQNIDIRNKYNIPKESKILLYVGNVCIRKNQGQIISAFKYLSPKTAESTYILFLGNDSDENYSIERLAENSPYKEHFIACGAIEKDMVPMYYKQADGAALFSLSEGFGLSLVESMHFGIPSITFCDVDAFEDIFDVSSMIGVKGHEDIDVANGIEELLSRKWIKEDIIKYSKKFEKEAMAVKYLSFFQSLINK